MQKAMYSSGFAREKEATGYRATYRYRYTRLIMDIGSRASGGQPVSPPALCKHRLGEAGAVKWSEANGLSTRWQGPLVEA